MVYNLSEGSNLCGTIALWGEKHEKTNDLIFSLLSLVVFGKSQSKKGFG